MARVRPEITNTALLLAGAIGAITTMVLLVGLGGASLLIGAGAAAFAGGLSYAGLARRHRRRLAITMATTVGELPPVPRDTTAWPAAPPPPPGLP